MAGLILAKNGFLLLLGSSSISGEGLSLGLETLLLLLGTTLSGLLVLGAVSVSLLFDGLNTGVFILHLVDSLDQVALVLVDVSLDLKVEVVVQVLVNLLLFAILDKETTENAHTADPEELFRGTGVGSTLSLTVAGVTSQSLSRMSLSHSKTRVDLDGQADDHTLLEQLTNRLTRVGGGDVRHRVRVKMNTTLTASLLSFHTTSHQTLALQTYAQHPTPSKTLTYKNGSRQTLLQLKGDHFACSIIQHIITNNLECQPAAHTALGTQKRLIFLAFLSQLSTPPSQHHSPSIAFTLASSRYY